MNTKEEVTKEIAQVFFDFIRKYNIKTVYFKVDDTISVKSRCWLNFSVFDELDHLTGNELKEIRSKMYEDIVDVLNKYSIEEVRIETVMRGWQVREINLSFTETFKLV